MSVLSKTALNTAIDTVIATNGTNSITAAQLNAILGDMVDSYEDLIVEYTYVQMLAIASPVSGQKVLITDFPNSGNKTLFIYTGTYWKPWCGMVILESVAASVGTDAATTEKTLATYSLPANYLNQNFDYIEIEAWGTFSANTNTKQLRLKFGSTTFATTAEALNNYVWKIKANILMTAAATQDMFTVYNALTLATVGIGVSGSGQFQQPTETLSGAITISITGQNGTATANDIVYKGWVISLHRK